MNRNDAAHHPVEALSALIDGELDAAERGPLEAHLETCAGCRDLLEDLRVIDRSVAAEPVPAPPPDLARRIAAALMERASAPPARAVAPMRRAFFRAPMSLAAAASLVVATLVWLAWPGGRPLPVPEPPAAPAPLVVVPPAAPSPGPDDLRSLKWDESPPAAPRPEPAGAPDKNRDASTPPVTPQGRRATSPAARDREEAGGHEAARRANPSPAPDDETESFAWGEAGARMSEVQSGVQAGGAPAGVETGAAAPAASAIAREESKLAAASIAAQSLRGTPLPAIRATPYSVRLVEANSMQVETEAYACTVTLTPEDARILVAQYALLQPATAATPARSDAPAAAAPSAGNEVRPSAAKRAVAGAGVATIDVTPEARALILTLVRDRYRAAIEQQCGPLPR